MPANHRTFNHPDLTGLFYCDTSYLAGAYLPFSRTYQRFHAECEAFHQRLYAASDAICVTSDWALNEIIYLIQQEQLSRDCQQYNTLHRTALTAEEFRRQNPTVLANSYPEVVQICEDIKIDCLMIAIPDTDLVDSALDLIRNFHRRPTDAYHLATAKSYDIANFVSIDRDFLRVDGITVYTCLPV